MTANIEEIDLQIEAKGAVLISTIGHFKREPDIIKCPDVDKSIAQFENERLPVKQIENMDTMEKNKNDKFSSNQESISHRYTLRILNKNVNYDYLTLSFEIWCGVFDLLTLKDLLIFRLISKRFAKLAENHDCWKNIVRNNYHS